MKSAFNRYYTCLSTVNELNLSVIRKISMFTILIDKICSLVIIGLVDVGGFRMLRSAYISSPPFCQIDFADETD